MMDDLFERVSSQGLADIGMASAVAHADAKQPNWSDDAVSEVRFYATFNREFLGEEVRQWAHERQGLSKPPKACAWGAVMVRAARDGLIERAGYRTTSIPPQHAKPAVLWRSLIYREVA